MRLADHRQQIRIDLFGHQTTITEIRIHGYEYDSNIKAASCVVALDRHSMSCICNRCLERDLIAGLGVPFPASWQMVPVPPGTDRAR